MGDDSIIDRLVPHLKKIGVAVGAIIVILAVVFTWRWYKHSQEEKSTRTLVKALDLAERPVVPAEIELPPEIAAMQPPSWKTYAERSDQGLAALSKAGQTRSAAALYEAGLLLGANKLDQALAIYRKVGAGKTEDGVLAREGIGIVLENQAAAATDKAQGQQLLAEALAAFQSAQPDDKGVRRDYALYNEARVLEALGKPDQAVAQLRRALELAPTSSLKPQIENRLAVLGASAKP